MAEIAPILKSVFCFHRWRDTIAVFAIVTFMGGAAVFIQSFGGALVTPDTYGPAVYNIPAELWALTISASAWLQLTGALFNGRFMVAAGSIILIQTIGTFTYLSHGYGGDLMLFVISVTIFLPLELFFLAVSTVSYGGDSDEDV